MPAVSKSQQRLMGAAEHGADFPMAKKVRASMTTEQLHDFAAGSEKGKPEHVKPKRKMAAKADPNHESYAYNWRSRNNLQQNQKGR